MHRRNTLFLSLAALSLSAIPSAFALEGGSFDAPDGAGDPGWANVGTVGVGSCVFLGSSATGYWVLSVAHAGVTDFSSVTFGTGTYSVVAGSRFSFTNPDSSVADLTLFRISGDSSLAALNSISISSMAPDSGSTVTQIGYGGGLQSWGNTMVTVADSFGSIDADVHKSYTFQSRDMTVRPSRVIREAVSFRKTANNGISRDSCRPTVIPAVITTRSPFSSPITPLRSTPT